MRVLRLALSIVTALVFTATMVSAQAAPGTTVTNTIDLSYSSGGTTITEPEAASVSFTVDRKIDLNVDGLDAGGTVFAEQGADDPVLSFLVENLGNDTQGFDIDVISSGSLDLTYANAPGGEGTYYVVISDSATPGEGTEVPYNVAGLLNAGDLAPNGRYYVHIYANIATSAASGQSRTFDVVATALDAGTNTVAEEERGQGIDDVDTIFADPGTDGQEAASEELSVNAPTLTASKSVVVVSENLDGNFDCADGSLDDDAEAPIPGACVEYTITVTNGGGATLAARDLQIVDALPEGVTYVDHDAGSFSSAVLSDDDEVTAIVDELGIGATASFTIRATVGSD